MRDAGVTTRASTCSRCARCGATTSASSTARTSTSRRRGRGRSRRRAGGPPVLIGGAAGPKLFAHIAEYADGWIPIGGAGVREALPELQRACEARGSRPADAADRARSARCRRPGRSSTTRRSASPSSCCASRAAIATRCCPVSTATPSSSGRELRRSSASTHRVRRRRGAPRASPSQATRVASRQSSIGSVRMRIGEPGPGITGWTLAGIPTGTTSIDGLPTRAGDPSAPSPSHHRSRTRTTRSAIDHVVVWSVDDARTIDALVAAGFEVRRVREDARPGYAADLRARGRGHHRAGHPRRPRAAGGPAAGAVLRHRVHRRRSRRVRALLGDALGPITDAVQPGRRIATLRGQAIGLEVPIAFMSADERPVPA